MSDPDLWLKSGRRHGFEFTTNAPMVLAKKLGIATKQAASLLEERLWADQRFRELVEKLEYWQPRVPKTIIRISINETKEVPEGSDEF